MISQLTRYAVIITFSNIFINSIGNLLLIPHFGFKAAAAMTVVSELNQAFFYFYFVRKKIVAFKFLRHFVKPTAAAAIMALLIYPIRSHSLILTVPIGAAIYILLIFGSGFINLSEIKNLRKLFSRSPESSEAI